MLVYTVSEETWGLQGLLLLGFVVGFLSFAVVVVGTLEKKTCSLQWAWNSAQRKLSS